MSRLRTIFLAPAAVIMTALFLAPLVIVFAYSFLSRGAYFGLGPPVTFSNYARAFDALYLAVLWRSLLQAALATVLCLVLGFPLALFISRSGARKTLYLNLVMLPFWTSFLVRLYAWMFLLRDTGLINTILMRVGIIHDPLPMLYNDGAVILGLVYGHLPFMVLPLFTSLERLDPVLVEASADLGARPLVTLIQVTLPLCRPGIMAGAVLVFIPCLGAYLVPDLLGGGKSVMIGNIIQNQFTTARDWPFGAALSFVVTMVVMLLVAAAARRLRNIEVQ
jgi:spermidine/putrescine transport system permease protein